MKNNRFVVYSRTTGGCYLALRKTRKAVTQPKYTWCKDRSRAVKLSKDRARHLAESYVGSLVAV